MSIKGYRVSRANSGCLTLLPFNAIELDGSEECNQTVDGHDDTSLMHGKPRPPGMSSASTVRVNISVVFLSWKKMGRRWS